MKYENYVIITDDKGKRHAFYSFHELIKYLDVYLGLKIDPKPLMRQAEEFENKLKDMIKISAKVQNGKKDTNPEDLSYLG